MSEKLADHGVLVPVVPSGAVPGSPSPDTLIPTSAINAANAAAMTMPRRPYRGAGGRAAKIWLASSRGALATRGVESCGVLGCEFRPGFRRCELVMTFPFLCGRPRQMGGDIPRSIKA